MMPVKIRIFAALLLALLLAASAGPSQRLWGGGVWGAVSFTAAVVAALACLPFLSAGAAGRLSRALVLPRRARGPVAAAVLVAGVAALWGLRCGHFLFGGRFSEGLLAGAGGTSPAAPLSSLLLRGIFAGLNRLFFWNAFDAAALLAVLGGLVWALSSRAALGFVLRGQGADGAEASAAGTEAGARGWTFAALLAGGYAAVFFGCGAAPALGVAAAGLFILASLAHLGGRAPLLLPALALLLAVAMSGWTIFLAGGFAVLLIGCLADPARRREAVPALLVLVLGGAAGELAIGAATGGPGTAGVLARALRAAAPRGQSGAAIDAANIIVVSGPTAVLGVILLAASAWRRELRGGPPERFLAATALSALLLVALAAPKVRAGVRADLFAPAGAALAFWGVAALGRLLRDPGRLVQSAVLLACLGLFHLAPLVAVDASLEWGRRRALALPLPPGRAEHLIGAQAMHERDWTEAARWLAQAAEKNPDDAGILYRLGRTEMRLDEPLDAIRHFALAKRIDPDETAYRVWLAEAFIARQWYAEAAAELDTLTASYPDSARLWTRLGYARNHGGRYAGAIEAYQRALALEPQSDEYARNLTSALLNRGAELQEAGDDDGARGMYLRARATYPLDWISSNNLSVLEMERGNWEEAHRILTGALATHPHIPQLHYNMARVKEHFGEYAQALYHMRQGAALDRYGTPPVEEIGRLEAIVEELGLELPADTTGSAPGP